MNVHSNGSLYSTVGLNNDTVLVISGAQYLVSWPFLIRNYTHRFIYFVGSWPILNFLVRKKSTIEALIEALIICQLC